MSVMRLPEWSKKALRRFDIEVTHYSTTHNARRNRLLTYLGITDLIDVGANAGQYARLVRTHGYDGRLWSFEPLSQPFKSLQRASRADSKWEVVQLALGDDTREL